MTNDTMAPAFVCRCEELTEIDLREAITAGALTINDVKRRTRAGMGLCQGVYCLDTVANLLTEMLGQPRGSINPMTARPPVRALTLDSLANLTEPEQ